MKDKIFIINDDCIWRDESCSNIVSVTNDKDIAIKLLKDYVKKVKEEVEFESIEEKLQTALEETSKDKVKQDDLLAIYANEKNELKQLQANLEEYEKKLEQLRQTIDTITGNQASVEAEAASIFGQLKEMEELPFATLQEALRCKETLEKEAAQLLKRIELQQEKLNQTKEYFSAYPRGLQALLP